jgi:hypothetical protein
MNDVNSPHNFSIPSNIYYLNQIRHERCDVLLLLTPLTLLTLPPTLLTLLTKLTSLRFVMNDVTSFSRVKRKAAEGGEGKKSQ